MKQRAFYGFVAIAIVFVAQIIVQLAVPDASDGVKRLVGAISIVGILVFISTLVEGRNK